MTQIPSKLDQYKGYGQPFGHMMDAINQLITYLTSREELEDARHKELDNNVRHSQEVFIKLIKELTSRIDTIAGNQLEMKRGDQPKRWREADIMLALSSATGFDGKVDEKKFFDLISPIVAIIEREARLDVADQPKHWRAEIENDYWYVEDCGEISKDYESDQSVDDFRYAIGNYHPTREAAQAYKAKLLVDNQQ